MANRTVSVRLQAEIGQYVSGMAKAALVTKGLGDSAEQSSKRARSAFDLAGRGALLLGTGVAAALVGVVMKSMDFERAMSAAAAATQATGSELLALREAAMEAGAATQYSATEAAAAITELGKAGISTADILGGGLAGALDLAAAGQLDVAQAAEIAATAMTQFKLSGDELPHVADLLAAGAGKAQGSVGDLGMALNQAGLVASATGLSIEETTGTLAAFASAGLIGSDAGTSFRSMLQHLQNPSKESAEALAALGISMYDANGQFVGMESLAGQLQTKLSGLTQAQRDQAMAQIFGSDAVRAANVLYEQGAQGIAEWTAKVNDAGFAQRQAAMLTDNLAGDLERLGGAFDTLLITLGEGGQGPLRSLVQLLESTVEGITWLVEAFQSLPGPVQTALGALLAVKLLGGPLNSMMDALAPKITGLATGMGMAAKNAAGFRGALSSLAGAINPVTAGLALATAGITYYMQESAEVEARLDAAAAAGDSFRSTLAQQGGELNLTARAAAELAVEAAGLSDAFERIGISGATVNAALTGNAAAYEETRAALEEYDRQQTVTSNGFQPFGVGFDVLTGKATESADAFDEMLGKTEGIGEVTVTSAGAFGIFAEAASGATPAVGAMAEETETFAEAASAAGSAVDELQAALDALTGKTVSMFEAESQLAEAVAQAEGALEGLTGEVLNADGSLNAYSESGRAAGGVLIGIRDKGNQLIATMQQQGASTGAVVQANADLRASFITAAGQMGITGAAAELLADQILGIPSERNVRVGVETEAARIGLQAIHNLLFGLRDKTINVHTNYSQTAGGAPRGVAAPNRAAGGPVSAGMPYTVGEYGRETFVPRVSGTIVPAHETRAIMQSREFSGSSGSTVNVAAPSMAGVALSARIFIGTREITDIVRVEVDDSMGSLAGGLSSKGVRVP